MKKIPYSWLLFGPYVLFVLGLAANAAVIFANGHQMPVYPPLHECHLLDPQDVIHTCMNSGTHLKILGDLFVSNDGVASIGDYLMAAGEGVAIPALVAWCLLVVCDTAKKLKNYF
jgi:hypothetical protein